METLTINNLDTLKNLNDNMNLTDLKICVDKEPFVLGDLSFLSKLNLKDI